GLTAECDRAAVKLGVIYQDRAAPELVWVRQLIAGGGLGRPIVASARVRWYRPPEYYAGSRWRGTWGLDGGGALMNQGIHTVDLLVWLLGDVDRVYAATRTALHDIAVEDTAVASLEFAGGAVGTLEATTAAFPGLPRRVELTGSEGTIVVEQARVVSVQLRPAPDPPPHPPGDAARSGNASASSPVIADATGPARVLENFIGAVRRGGGPRVAGAPGPCPRTPARSGGVRAPHRCAGALSLSVQSAHRPVADGDRRPGGDRNDADHDQRRHRPLGGSLYRAHRRGGRAR